ncbi:MAG: hypothetical protein KKH08_06270 [Candidatus Omnitrophica bacterium]|nr:hypothetical protein [Candidatus Omnitrophota bacterium]
MPIFPRFIETKSYSEEMQNCIRQTVEQLITSTANVTHPGMLLGKIQSGKTRTFIGIIALAFDRGYHTCVVFTKGTRALTEQTYKRLQNEFIEFTDTDNVKVYDIMNMPAQLTPYIRRQKLIIVVKKQTHNLDNLVRFFNTYADLAEKRTLLVDDEADFASVGFRRDRTQQDGISMNVLANKINHIRAGFANNYKFLQVTATPYSLYLQPRGEIMLNNFEVEPIKPVFTTLVPIYDTYIGGKEYFELSQDPNTIFSHLHIQVPDSEMFILGKRDQRYIGNILTTPNLQVFRQAIVNYLVAGVIRIIQNRQEEEKKYKSSFVIHTSTTRNRHQWQVELTEALIQRLTGLATNNAPRLENLVRIGYDNLSLSIQKNGETIPEFTNVLNMFKEILLDGMVAIVKINSENQILSLLDNKGQLRLDNPFNIFIGGQILDRGLTIENLIGFFYGRNPNRFQQDTVLQHSRMYGNRSLKDISVTRLYTSNRIYRALRTMREFDTALREAFESGVHNQSDGVIFIESDTSGAIRPCAPNKILITSTATVRPSGRFLPPIGFQTKSRTTIQDIVNRINEIINRDSGGILTRPFLMESETAIEIINLIGAIFEYGERWGNIGYEWSPSIYIAVIRRLTENITSPELRGKIYCYAQTDRNINRLKNNNTAFTDAPDDGRTDIPIARNVAIETPCLILLKQNGLSTNGWRDAEFWWPVLFTPANTRTAVFATETID